MGEISDVDVQDLQTTYRNFFRLETLKEANDLIANATAKLSIFRHYDIETDVLHSSSDGQRFETQRNTINARYASFEDYARKMYHKYKELDVPTWIIGPPVGELAESRTPTQVMKVWPSRDDIVTTTADEFNAELDALLDKHCLCV
jgi:hypothetical protein